MLKFIVSFLLFIFCTTTNQFVLAMQNTNSTDYTDVLLFINLSVLSKAEIAQIKKHLDQISLDNKTRTILERHTEILLKMPIKERAMFLSKNILITDAKKLFPFILQDIFQSWEIIYEITNFKNFNKTVCSMNPLISSLEMITCPDCCKKGLGFISFLDPKLFAEHILEYHTVLKRLENCTLTLDCRYLNCHHINPETSEDIEEHIKKHAVECFVKNAEEHIREKITEQIQELIEESKFNFSSDPENLSFS